MKSLANAQMKFGNLEEGWGIIASENINLYLFLGNSKRACLTFKTPKLVKDPPGRQESVSKKTCSRTVFQMFCGSMKSFLLSKESI